MKNVFCVCVIALFGVAFLAPATFAADSCGGGCPKPPKKARAVSANFQPLMPWGGNVLNATLAKGLKKRILVADGVLTANLFAAGEYLMLGIFVNGAPMEPGLSGSWEFVQFCDSDEGLIDGGRCAVVGQWWLDLDDPANAALLGVPLTVTLVGGGNVAGGFLVDMSLRVRLDKK